MAWLKYQRRSFPETSSIVFRKSSFVGWVNRYFMNTGGRWGGAVTAAMFLKEFAEDTPWIHLDIAGTAWMEDQKPWIAKGPSGIALRSLVEFVKGFVA